MAAASQNSIRILVAKPGLDGHDRGAKVIAHALRDAGFEVIYSGLHQTVDQIISAAMQEAVDVIGLSIMSGAHLPISQKLMAGLKEKDMSEVAVVVGGVIPHRDIPALKDLGIDGVYPGGTALDDIIAGVRQVAGERGGA
jgi:methylmalonyl-CoA mutase C-terminal domain/subunit